MNRFGKRAVTPRTPKPYIESVAPAVLAECRRELERQIAASHVGGRPRVMMVDKVMGALPRSQEASRRGGLKGGPARAKALSPERRSEIASKAAHARYAK